MSRLERLVQHRRAPAEPNQLAPPNGLSSRFETLSDRPRDLNIGELDEQFAVAVIDRKR
jgi:hypothetical protein